MVSILFEKVCMSRECGIMYLKCSEISNIFLDMYERDQMECICMQLLPQALMYKEIDHF